MVWTPAPSGTKLSKRALKKGGGGLQVLLLSGQLAASRDFTTREDPPKPPPGQGDILVEVSSQPSSAMGRRGPGKTTLPPSLLFARPAIACWAIGEGAGASLVVSHLKKCEWQGTVVIEQAPGADPCLQHFLQGSF